MTKTRLQVLAEVLGIEQEGIKTRNSLLSEKSIDPNSDEFIVINGRDEVFYNVLKGEELDNRVEELINECYSEEEIAENYPLGEDGEPDLSSAELNTYMDFVEEREGYHIYKNQ